MTHTYDVSLSLWHLSHRATFLEFLSVLKFFFCLDILACVCLVLLFPNCSHLVLINCFYKLHHDTDRAGRDVCGLHTSLVSGGIKRAGKLQLIRPQTFLETVWVICCSEVMLLQNVWRVK